MREKGQTEVAKTLETPVFSRGIEILTEKYQFFIIPTKDIRDKKAVKAREATCGMMTERGELKPEYQHQMSKLLHELNDCL